MSLIKSHKMFSATAKQRESTHKFKPRYLHDLDMGYLELEHNAFLVYLVDNMQILLIIITH